MSGFPIPPGVKVDHFGSCNAVIVGRNYNDPAHVTIEPSGLACDCGAEDRACENGARWAEAFAEDAFAGGEDLQITRSLAHEHRSATAGGKGRPDMSASAPVIVDLFGNAEPDSLLGEITAVIRETAAGSARSQQKAIGPSEVGTPCARKLAYRLLDAPKPNALTDPLPSLLGIGGHSWLAAAFTAANLRAGRERWIIERRVQCGVIAGSCDLYDTDTRTVIDFKFPGGTAMTAFKNHGPSETYRIQVHTYGLGFTQAGYAVDRVGVLALPRSGMLTQARLHLEPFDASIAERAQDRLMTIAAATDALAAAHGGDMAAVIAAIPPTADHCAWCAWWSPSAPDLSTGCPGADAQDAKET